jgi:hypothetical protein
MQTRTHFYFAILLVLSLVLGACRPAPPVEQASPTPEAEVVLTAAAQTAEAQLTEQALPSPTIWLPPTETLQPSPTNTPTPEGTPATPDISGPDSTLVASPSAQDVAEFFADISVPDGSNFNPGEKFTKTWRIKNSGASTWTTQFSLAFVGGAQMGGPNAAPLTRSVQPGDTIDISVDLTAPNESGEYRGFWKMRNAAADFFDFAVYVEINVVGGTPAATNTPGPASDAIVSDVTLSVDDASATACPHTFTFTGTFTLDKQASVTYQLQAGSDTPGFNFTLPGPITGNFPAGTHTVVYTLNLSDRVNGWASLRVTSPNEVASGQVTFSLTCP